MRRNRRNGAACDRGLGAEEAWVDDVGGGLAGGRVEVLVDPQLDAAGAVRVGGSGERVVVVELLAALIWETGLLDASDVDSAVVEVRLNQLRAGSEVS